MNPLNLFRLSFLKGKIHFERNEKKTFISELENCLGGCDGKWKENSGILRLIAVAYGPLILQKA